MKDYIKININDKDKIIIFTKHLSYVQFKEGKLTMGTDSGQTITVDSEDSEEVLNVILGVFDEVDVEKE